MSVINFPYWARNREHVASMSEAYGSLLLNIDDLLSFENRDPGPDDFQKQFNILENIKVAAGTILEIEHKIQIK